MHDTFVSLAEYLRGPVPTPPEPVVAGADESGFETSPHAENPADEEALAEIRRFRAALADALDVRIERLLGDIAAGVLARELHLAPADLRAIVARELALAGEPPVTLYAHPDECERLRGFAGGVVADPALLRGDVRIEVRSGTIVATLGARLERALAAVPV
jgi:flagellar biosynthesis/type III secretory pathway protein FliH